MLSGVGFSATIANLFVFGLVLSALSPTFYAVAGNAGRLAILAIGISCIAVVAVVGMVRAFATREIFRWLLLSAVILTIELLCVANSEIGYNSSWLAYRFVCYIYAASGLFFSEANISYRPNWIVQLAVGSLAILCSIAWLTIVAASMAEPGRFSGDTETFSPVGLAFSFGLGSMICLVVAIFGNSLLVSSVPLAGSFAMLYCLLSTGSRGALVALVLSVVILGLTRFRKLISSPGKVLLVFTVLTVPVIGFVGSPKLREQGGFVIDRFTKIGDPYSDRALVERSETRAHYQERIASWIIFGDPKYGEITYPHNLFIEIAVRFGLPIGSVLCFFMLRSFVRSVASELEEDCIHNLISVLGWYGLILAQFNTTIEFNRTLFCFVAYWSFVNNCHGRLTRQLI